MIGFFTGLALLFAGLVFFIHDRQKMGESIGYALIFIGAQLIALQMSLSLVMPQ